MKSTPEYVSAIAALTKILEIKQFGILEDFSYLLNMPFVQEINNKAKEIINVDLFATKETQSLARYTSFLNEQIKSDLLPTKNISGLDDEIELLINANYIPPTDLGKYKLDVTITRTKEVEKEYLHALNLTKPHIISLARTADYVQELAISPKVARIFLASTKCKVRTKECIVLFVLSEVKEPHSVFSIDKKLIITSVYLFNETNPRFTSPARLFIQMLDKYGRSITLGFKTQRFFYNGMAPGVYSTKELDKMFPARVGSPAIQGGTRTTPLGLEYYFFHVVDIFRLMADIRKTIFI